MKREIDLSGLSPEYSGGILTIKGAKGRVARKLTSPFVSVSLDGGKLKLETKREGRRAKATFETFSAHVQNMRTGAEKGFSYVLEITQAHFPMKVTLQGSTLKIENFIGEKNPRVVKIPSGVAAKIEGKDLILSGADIETVANAAQRVEDATKIKKKDHRTFQDGIYIIEKKKVGA